MSVISFNTIHLEQNMGHGKDVDIPFFSVAMSVYGKDNPDWFDKALCSVIDQTVQPVSIVLVVDGPIQGFYTECNRQIFENLCGGYWTR